MKLAGTAISWFGHLMVVVPRQQQQQQQAVTQEGA
jgi:hypothetical protein